MWLIRSLLTEVLEEKMRGGQFGLDVAKRVACAILLDNPLAFYGMTEEEVPSLEEEPAAGCATGDAQRAVNVQLPFLDPEG